MKKFLALSLILALVLGLGATAYASTSEGEVSDIVEEFTGVFRRGFGRNVDNNIAEELKDLTTEEQLNLLEEKLANEEITQEVYDRLVNMAENGCTFEPAMDGTGFRKGANLIDKSIFEELKDLTTEEQLNLLEEKLANEEITQEAYDRLVNMTENGCTFNPAMDGSNQGNKFRTKGNFKGRKGMRSQTIGTEL